jgi:hypothetical protein
MRASSTLTMPRARRRRTKIVPRPCPEVLKAEEPLESLGRCEGWGLLVRLLLWSTRNGATPSER